MINSTSLETQLDLSARPTDPGSPSFRDLYQKRVVCSGQQWCQQRLEVKESGSSFLNSRGYLHWRKWCFWIWNCFVVSRAFRCRRHVSYRNCKDVRCLIRGCGSSSRHLLALRELVHLPKALFSDCGGKSCIPRFPTKAGRSRGSSGRILLSGCECYTNKVTTPKTNTLSAEHSCYYQNGQIFIFSWHSQSKGILMH